MHLAPKSKFKAANQELPFINPSSRVKETGSLKSGNTYPWWGDSLGTNGTFTTYSKFGEVPPNFNYGFFPSNAFGDIPPNFNYGLFPDNAFGEKKQLGWVKKGDNYIEIYKFKGMTGRRYKNKTKVPKNKKLIKANAFGVNFVGDKINPSNKTNYQYYQWANNAGTPTLAQMNKIQSDTAAYTYPLGKNMKNNAWWGGDSALTGMGF